MTDLGEPIREIEAPAPIEVPAEPEPVKVPDEEEVPV